MITEIQILHLLDDVIYFLVSHLLGYICIHPDQSLEYQMLLDCECANEQIILLYIS